MRILKIISLYVGLQIALYVPYLFIISNVFDLGFYLIFTNAIIVGWILLIDKYLLFHFKIRECLDSEIRNIVENHLGRMGIDKVSVFLSKRYGDNVYAFQGVGNRKFLVIGSDVLKGLSPKEREAIIVLSLATLKDGRGRYITLSTSLLILLELPLILLKQIFEIWPFKKLKGIEFVIRSLIYAFNHLVCIETKEIEKTGKNVQKYFENIHYVNSALYRLKAVKEGNNRARGGIAIDNLGVVSEDMSIIEEIFKLGSKTEKRYGDLGPV